MKAKLVVNSAEVELGFKDLEWIAEFLEDSPRNTGIFYELAKSESYAVRTAIAAKSNIGPEIFDLLINDSSGDVLRALSSNSIIGRFLNQDSVTKFIETEDPEILVNMVDNLFELSLIVDVDHLFEILMQNDVSVRYALAKNQATPAFFISELSHDRDINVALQAKQGLKDINF